MNQPPNVYFLGGGAPQQPQGHRPRRRRKNRDQRKKDAENKKEKETKATWNNYKKAMWHITVFAPLIIIPLSWSLVGLLKLTILLQHLNLQMLEGIIK